MNVFIFVSDSLRFDFLPPDIEKMGISLKTIASSLYTASSFPSILTGLYPPRHGVYTWSDVLAEEKKSLLDLEGFHTSLWCETTWTESGPDESGIHRTLNHPRGIPLNDIKEPFVFIEDDKGGHCPYGISFGQYMGGGCPDFFKEYGAKGKEKLVSQYEKGIEQSRRNFLKRIQVLKNRGLMHRTLIIFTSDHGELLGEYGGLTGHVRPPCPELVYVPTVFIHPGLKNKKSRGYIIRHVDLVPTICGFLKVKYPKKLDGVNVFDGERFPEYGFNFLYGGSIKKRMGKRHLFAYKAQSVWDHKGGWIFYDFNRIKGLFYFLYKLRTQEFYFLMENIKSKKFKSKWRDVKKALKHLTKSSLEYQKPCFTKHQAHSMLQNYLKKVGILDSQGIKISDKEKEQLKGLGYID